MGNIQTGKMSIKAYLSELIAKSGAVFITVAIPSLLGNLVLWVHSKSTKKPMRVATMAMLMLASFSIGVAIYAVCAYFKISGMALFVIIWWASLFTNRLIQFIYVEGWEMFREWLRNTLRLTLEKMNKNQKQ